MTITGLLASGPGRVGAVVLALGVALGGGLALGHAVGPVGAGSAAGTAAERVVLAPPSGGASTDGVTVALTQPDLAAGPGTLAFRLLDASGAAVTDVEIRHDKPLHLVLVRRDLGDYHHLHPTLDPATGTWTTPVDLTAGTWRLYADVVPAGGDEVVAETDLQVAGDFAPRPLPADSDVARVDGYEVHLTRAAGRLSFHVTRDGQDVVDLEPYLGAYGHLVAIRTDDLAYAHVHPTSREPGPTLDFSATLSGPARHRLYLEFQHAGTVHRAELTVSVEAGAAAPATPAGGEDGHGGHQH